jgi:hypothetical protein
MQQFNNTYSAAGGRLQRLLGLLVTFVGMVCLVPSVAPVGLSNQLGAVGGFFDIPAAQAWTAYTFATVTTTPVRNGPSIRSTQVATFAANTPVQVVCQTGGSRIDAGAWPANSTWSRLADGRWIHDVHLSTPGNGTRVNFEDGRGSYALFSSGIPQCTPAILGRGAADAAAWWAETQMGNVAYDGWCLAFANSAWRWGAARSLPGASTAIARWNAIPAASRTEGGEPGFTTPPRGALVFWRYGSTGHVAVSAGNGYVVTTYYGGPSHTVSWANISHVTATGKPYVGWWMPA